MIHPGNKLGVPAVARGFPPDHAHGAEKTLPGHGRGVASRKLRGRWRGVCWDRTWRTFTRERPGRRLPGFWRVKGASPSIRRTRLLGRDSSLREKLSPTTRGVNLPSTDPSPTRPTPPPPIPHFLYQATRKTQRYSRRAGAQADPVIFSLPPGC